VQVIAAFLRTKRRGNAMSENTKRKEKKIGHTTYTINISFNGDKRHNIADSVIWLVEHGLLSLK